MSELVNQEESPKSFDFDERVKKTSIKIWDLIALTSNEQKQLKKRLDFLYSQKTRLDGLREYLNHPQLLDAWLVLQCYFYRSNLNKERWLDRIDKEIMMVEDSMKKEGKIK